MTEVWFQTSLWIELALMATLLPLLFREATALSEIIVGLWCFGLVSFSPRTGSETGGYGYDEST